MAGGDARRRAGAGRAEAQAGVIPPRRRRRSPTRAGPSSTTSTGLCERGPGGRESGRAARPGAAGAGRRRRRPLRPLRRDEPGRRSTRPRCSSPGPPARLILDELGGCAAACAGLAEAHRSTPMAARTLLQQAVPTTFGLKAAGWLVGARRGPPAARGGASCRRSSAAPPGRSHRSAPPDPRCCACTRPSSDLAEPTASVARPPGARRRARRSARRGRGGLREGRPRRRAARADRGRRGCGGVGRRLVDDAAQAEPGPRRSSPARAPGSCTRTPALLTSGEHEHERAAGAWQAEWPALSAALAFAGGAAAAARGCLDGLEVDAGTHGGEHDRIAVRGARRVRRARPDRARRGLPGIGGGLRRPGARAATGRRRSEAAPPSRRPGGLAGARVLELDRDDARALGSAGAGLHPGLPGAPLRPARPRPLGGSARAVHSRARSAASCSACSTDSGSSAPRSAGSRSAARSACGSARTRPSVSTGSCWRPPPRTSGRPSGGSSGPQLVRSEGMEPIADAAIGALVHAGLRGREPLPRSASLATPPEGYAACCDALARLGLPRPARRRSASRRSSSSARRTRRRLRRTRGRSRPASPARGLVVVESAAHLLNVEQAEAFDRAVLDHLTVEEAR